MTDNIHARATTNKSRAFPISEFKHRDTWIRQLLAVDGGILSAGAKVVGVRIALHLNVETGRCDPSIGELVAGTGMSESTVRRMIHGLEDGGWLLVDRSRGRHSNSFELHTPTLSHVEGLNPVSDERVEGSNPVSCERVHKTPTLSAVTPQPCQGRHPNPVTADTQKRESKSERKAKEKDSPPDLLEDFGRRQSATSSIDADFEVWWVQYPLKKSKEAARKAYRTVRTKKLATAEELLAGAMRYAAERSGQDSKFTKHPANWLVGGCWADEPAKPSGVTLDGDGRWVAPARSAPHQQPSWIDIAMGDYRGELS
jgi:hypothetical protein